MSVDRSELHQLVDSLPDEEVAPVADDLRRRTRPRAVVGRAFAWIGTGKARNGVTDLSTNPQHLDGFGRDAR